MQTVPRVPTTVLASKPVSHADLVRAVPVRAGPPRTGRVRSALRVGRAAADARDATVRSRVRGHRPPVTAV